MGKMSRSAKWKTLYIINLIFRKKGLNDSSNWCRFRITHAGHVSPFRFFGLNFEWFQSEFYKASITLIKCKNSWSKKNNRKVKKLIVTIATGIPCCYVHWKWLQGKRTSENHNRNNKPNRETWEQTEGVRGVPGTENPLENSAKTEKPHKNGRSREP